MAYWDEDRQQPGPREPIAELVALLGRLPGIGERTASRLAFHILGTPPEYAQGLAGALADIHERVKRCTCCANFGADEICSICQDSRRDEAIVCVVARVPDLLALERSRTFRGRYHVLHGLLAPLDGMGPEDLPLDGLEQRVASGTIQELIVATPLSVEGEATALYIAEVFRDSDVQISRIASGVPHGGELEFTDQVTLGRALEGRKTLL